MTLQLGLMERAAPFTSVPDLDDRGYYSLTALVDASRPLYPPGVDAERLRRRLMRWRQTHPEGAWRELEDRTPGEPQYVYQLGAVKHLLRP